MLIYYLSILPIFGHVTSFWSFWNIWTFCISFYIIFKAFLGVLKSSYDDENMMSRNRIYVDPEEYLMDQIRKKILSRLLNQWRENIWVHNTLFITIKSYDNKNLLKEVENGSEGNLSELYVIIEVSPTLTWTFKLNYSPPVSNLLLLNPPLTPHPIFGMGPTMMTIFIIDPPPPTHTQLLHKRR